MQSRTTTVEEARAILFRLGIAKTYPILPGLLYLELSYCTSFIVFENVIATLAVLTLMPKFQFYSYSLVAWVLTPLLCCLAMWQKAERVQIHATSDSERQNRCQKLASRPMRSQEKFTHGRTDIQKNDLQSEVALAKKIREQLNNCPG